MTDTHVVRSAELVFLCSNDYLTIQSIENLKQTNTQTKNLIMKFSVALVALTAASVSAQSNRIRNCNFVQTFGSSGDGSLTSSSLESFTVVDGADVICYTGCHSGSATDVAFQFGSTPVSATVGTAATDSADDCRRIETTFTASGDQTSLGWSIATEGAYDKLVLGCVW